MNNNLQRFVSKKFLVALGTIALIAFEGSGIDEQVIMAVVAGMYLLGQSLIDHKEKGNEK